MVQQVAELMKHRLHFTMCQESWFAGGGWRHVAAHQAKVGSERFVLARMPGDKRIHPRSAPFVLARKPIRVEGAQHGPIPIRDVVELYGCVPGRHARPLGNAHAVEPAYDFKHAGQDAIERKVRPQHFFVEVILGPA